MTEIRRSTRRVFLRQSACAAVGMTALANTIFDLRRIAAAATVGDYRTLVCVFLYGGNDSNNVLVPTSASDYAAYAAARDSLALPSSSLLSLSPIEAPAGDSRTWGLHPNLPKLRGLFDGGRAAVVANVGPLVAPLTRDEFLNRTAAVPPQLFSHSDQTVHWQTSLPDQPARTGWGGRAADLLHSLNENAQISMSISLAGTNTFQVGNVVTQYQVSPEGPVGLSSYVPADQGADASSNAVRASARQELRQPFRARLPRHLPDRARQPGAAVRRAGLGAGAHHRLSRHRPRRATADDRPAGLGARGAGAQAPGLLLRRPGLRHARRPGRRDALQGAHADLLTELDGSLAAFDAAMTELAVADSVTTFTASDFGRTYLPNGNGSDHGWGGHHFVIGGAVRGGRFYGQMPTLAIGGPNDAGEGRWIPTTAVDEYAATLARWFGVAESDLALVLPNLGRFASTDLGFMG